ncbi:MAG: acyl carrier protein [Cyclobacteriaceae bacterium]|nr:acyl carrier protein [Cyclobacteriaceae bacterium]
MDGLTHIDFNKKFVALIAKNTLVAEEDIRPTLRFNQDMSMDSLDMANLVVEFENEFNVTFTDDEAEKIVTVKDARELLMKKLKPVL